MQTWRERVPRITPSCPASMQALSADKRLRFCHAPAQITFGSPPRQSPSTLLG